MFHTTCARPPRRRARRAVPTALAGPAAEAGGHGCVAADDERDRVAGVDVTGWLTVIGTVPAAAVWCTRGTGR